MKRSQPQSLPRPCHQGDDRSKRTYELTSSIVPRGTSCHRTVEFGFSPIGFPPAFSCCRDFFPAPPELGAVNQMRCMITPNRRASATNAFLSPRRLAIRIAQALSQDPTAALIIDRI